ncbi:putative transporter protein smf2 protein [Neofusicoccum parvum UCRNP2]|uniref:Putative transporter protein smf2 protein n=1 Tax=Botryosphaeria parva (strain UCR-NP2) TaxID=1287680 RepID=R1GHE6_BOTPV|nr:putative transporter protein smf2 protein [Neofusicoccum parvum UCRNP2]
MAQDLNANSTQRPAVERQSFASDRQTKPDVSVDITEAPASKDEPRRPLSKKQKITESLQKTKDVLYQYAKFIGPGFMVAVAYIDPGNYATDVAAGASFRFALLFVILMSNMFAIFLQSLSVKLGTVTGKNLAENSREHLPKWMNIVIYVLAEVAIIATDVAEVIGFAIALNVLGNVPLVAGCAISIVDVLIILLFYNPSGSTKAVRMFEYFVMLLVLEGIYQARLSSSLKDSIKLAAFLAIKTCLNFSVVETAVSLFTFALFVNSAILIVAGASLFNTPGAGDADLFGIHDLLSSTVAPAAGTIFALALLLSGVSAGIVCTIAGQMVSEGSLRWTIKPWIRRMITRSISITPSIIIAGAVGRSGLSAALVASQVCLSVILPFVSAPLIYFTCRDRFMTISAVNSRGDNLARDETGDNMSEKEVQTEDVKMTNSRLTSASALVIWLVIVVMNVTLLVLIGLGKA